MDERLYYLGFSAFSGVGPVKFGLLLNKFKTAKLAWSASEKNLLEVLGQAVGKQFLEFRQKFSPEQYEKILLNNKIWFVTLEDKEYPDLLKQTARTAFVLYGKGDKRRLDDENKLAIVGSRKITNYGRDVTQLFASFLADSGFTIVSGLAMGVDSVAHRATVEHHGKTIAVLGCGVDCCFPTVNQSLYNSILTSGGCIISELPLSHPPSKGSFPSRNRIIAGMSLGTLVTEGAEDSGSLITAEYALKFNRKVFAVPGPINSNLSKGPYKLIRKGASLVSEPSEILKELNVRSEQRSKNHESGIKQKVTKNEQEVLELLENEGMEFDEIVRRLKKDSSTVGSLLTLMEIKGMIKNTNGATFSLPN
ncbi:MAG TPA: DNA-processing protein DprA [Candidatus Saccharimonadales bacterium]|nr:DNA-processing protein DprA [Candidatus Saccharimonadales bacterium]